MLEPTDIALAYIPDWLVFGRQCNECLHAQLYTGERTGQFGKPAIVTIQEYHDSTCSRFPQHDKKTKFVLRERPKNE